MIMKLVVILSFIGLTIGAPTIINTDATNVAEEVVKGAVDEVALSLNAEEQIAEAELKAVVGTSIAIATDVKELAGKQQRLKAAVEMFFVPIGVPLSLLKKQQAKDGKLSGEALAKLEEDVVLSAAAGLGPAGAAIPLSNLIYHAAKDSQNDIKKIETNDDAAAKAIRFVKIAAPILNPIAGLTTLFI